MSGSIGLIIPQIQPESDNKARNGGVQIGLGSSEYHFNQVLDLVVPGSNAGTRPTIVHDEMLDAQSMKRISALLGESPERSSTSWKQVASATRKNSQGSASPANLVRNAYTIYSGIEKSAKGSSRIGIDVVSSTSRDSQ